MNPYYSPEVEKIFCQWLEAIENSPDFNTSIEVIDNIRKLIGEGKINSLSEIKKLVDDFGGNHAA